MLLNKLMIIMIFRYFLFNNVYNILYMQLIIQNTNISILIIISMYDVSYIHNLFRACYNVILYRNNNLYIFYRHM